jgi:hypothetical protein
MQIVHAVRVEATPEAIFAFYADVRTWPRWDDETRAVHLPEGLEAGSKGWFQPRSGPKAKIRVLDVHKGRSFTIEGLLPLCRMLFGHELRVDAGQTIVTHSVRFRGPLAFLFRRVIGAGIDRTLPTTLQGLKRAVENGAPP